MDGDLGRAIAFERWVLEATSTRVEPFPWGVAFFNDDHALRYDANLIWIDRPLRGVGVAMLASEIDLAMRDFLHREARIPDDSDGTRVALGLAELGYVGDHLLVMAYRREPDRPSESQAVEELDHDTIRPFLIETTLRERSGKAAGVAEALADYRSVLVDGVGCRFFAQRVDGRIAGACELYRGPGIAQIESVVTLEEFRGRGVAHNVVLRAVKEARVGGASLVFLLADLNDWPRRLYGRLGFDEIGRTWSFTKWPDGESPA
jgi:GNAT superfamily N-acetyltransferase